MPCMTSHSGWIHIFKNVNVTHKVAEISPLWCHKGHFSLSNPLNLGFLPFQMKYSWHRAKTRLFFWTGCFKQRAKHVAHFGWRKTLRLSGGADADGRVEPPPPPGISPTWGQVCSIASRVVRPSRDRSNAVLWDSHVWSESTSSPLQFGGGGDGRGEAGEEVREGAGVIRVSGVCRVRSILGRLSSSLTWWYDCLVGVTVKNGNDCDSSSLIALLLNTFKKHCWLYPLC